MRCRRIPTTAGTSGTKRKTSRTHPNDARSSPKSVAVSRSEVEQRKLSSLFERSKFHVCHERAFLERFLPPTRRDPTRRNSATTHLLERFESASHLETFELASRNVESVRFVVENRTKTDALPFRSASSGATGGGARKALPRKTSRSDGTKRVGFERRISSFEVA